MHRALLLTLATLGCADATVDAPDVLDTTDTSLGGVDTSDTDGLGDTGGPIDLTDVVLVRRSADCADHAATYFADVLDLQRSLAFTASVVISSDATSCTLASNAIPNHDFNDNSARFAEFVSEQTQTLTIPRNPTKASSPTGLTLRTNNGVMLNGVLVDLLAAGCYGVADGKIGCHDMNTPYRYDPMGEEGGFGVDQHHAHTQPGGLYHYHGDPVALWDDDPGAKGSPVVGFAADGFPIYGGYFFDGTEVRKAVSGYTLKQGTRPGGPGGGYDGTFVDDWAFTDAGDLDACNGMTVDGQYGYYLTDTYPWVLGCFSGTPDPSFDKQMGGPPPM